MSNTVMVLLDDCKRFVREFFPVLSTSSLQVYNSALMFTPSETMLRDKYAYELPPIRMQNGVEKTWHPCIRTIEGHSRTIESVAFSPDGTRIVSGSDDETLQLWNTVERCPPQH